MISASRSASSGGRVTTLPEEQPTRQRGLYDVLFRPASVALVGASDDPSKASSRPVAYLQRFGFGGRVHVVNPRRDSVGGLPSHDTLASLPEVPDHVFVLTGADAAVAVVEQCAELGVPAATVLAGGFAESGAEGARRQERLMRAARCGGVRLLGPNSLGLVDMRTGLRATGNAVFGDDGLPVGGGFVASQSGSMIGALATRGSARGIGFAALVSVGAEADLSIGEICRSTLDDSSITHYVLFLESLRHADELAAFARGAAARSKPVIVYKLGRSIVGGELAVSHTGSLAGEDDVASALFSQYGFVRVDSLDGLLEAGASAIRLPVIEPGGRAPRVGVVTTTGGGAAMVVDQLGLRGVEVVPPSSRTLSRLTASGVLVQPGRIVDLTLAGTRPETMTAALSVLLDSAEFDVVLAVAGSSARLEPETVVAPIAAAAAGGRPVTAFLVPHAPRAATLLRNAGVAYFDSPEVCADVLRAVLRRRPSRQVVLTTPLRPASRPRVLDEHAGTERLRQAGVPCAPSVVLDVAPREEVLQAIPFEYPVVVKALNAALPHKSDAGGVVLGVESPAGVVAAVALIARRVAAAGGGVVLRHVLVQPVISGVGELLVGYRVDPDVGPVVVLAGGGIRTELLRDRSVRLAPVTRSEATQMLDEVAAVTALDGFRGGPSIDRDAIVDAVVAMSCLAGDAEIIEAEVNPLIVGTVGAVAVDALVRVVDTP